MGFDQENYRRIRQEYETKYLRAREEADRRREEVHRAIPKTVEIDREMGRLGLRIMEATMSGDDPAEKMAELRASHEALVRQRRMLLMLKGFDPDYTEAKYECPLCSDTGFVDYVMCSCMKNKLVQAEYESSGVADLLRTQTFDNFSLDYYNANPQQYQKMKLTYQTMKDYAETFAPGQSGNLVLFGGTGLGKTHLSSAVAGRVIARGFNVYYTAAVGMLSDFEKQRFGNSSGGENRIGTYRYYDSELLIIDDLGTEVNNQFTASVLYDVINTRLNRRKATIISSNLMPDEFRTRYSDRITSRVFGEYAVMVFLGTDIRSQKLAQKKNQ